MQIESRFKKYSVDFADSLQKIFELADKSETFFVIDRKVYDLYKERLPQFDERRIFFAAADETKKNIDTVLAICEKMTAMPSKRNTHLVTVGGGIMQDITGFVAANLYRGIYWTLFPTTLLCACDSCIGGKSSLNYKGFKNLLGSFYPPDDIYICPAFLKTLSVTDYCSGLGEVIKFNVTAGGDKFAKLEADLDDILAHDYEKLVEYIKNSLAFKKKFIEADEFDRGERILLNYAHTFGHAFEVSSGYNIPHGLAVALGIIAANSVSVRRGFILAAYAERIEKSLAKILAAIKIKEEWLDDEFVLQAIKKDKKQMGKTITAVLLREDLSLGVFRDITEEEIVRADAYVRNRI